MGDYCMVSRGYEVDLLSQKGLQVVGFIDFKRGSGVYYSTALLRNSVV